MREALEALGAEGAARRRTEADLAELVARTEAVEVAADDLERYLEANLAWHVAVVRVSHNELLISIINVLSNAIYQATAIEVLDSSEVRESTLRIHRSILAAIRDGGAEAARRRMTRHVAAARRAARLEGGKENRPRCEHRRSRGNGRAKGQCDGKGRRDQQNACGGKNRRSEQDAYDRKVGRKRKDACNGRDAHRGEDPSVRQARNRG